jgi:excisionase family DNA binding protein
VAFAQKGNQSRHPKIRDRNQRLHKEEAMSEIMTVREVSEYLRVHSTTVYRLLKQRKLPAFKVGSDWRFDVDEIDLWRRGQEVGGLV